jgi:hypothetical protein
MVSWLSLRTNTLTGCILNHAIVSWFCTHAVHRAVQGASSSGANAQLGDCGGGA